MGFSCYKAEILVTMDFSCYIAEILVTMVFSCYIAEILVTMGQLLAHGRWFSPGTPASSTTKTGRHDIAELLLKVTLNTKNQSISINHFDINK